MRQCADCGLEIPELRIELLPDTKWCISCSDKHTFKSVARIIYSHKSDCELFVASNPEDARLLQRVYERAR